MLPLDSSRWSEELKHHFGSADSVSFAFKELYACLESDPLDESRYTSAFSEFDSEIDNMFHQTCLCTAITPAMPHILELASRLKLKDQIGVYFVCGWMDNEGAGWVLDEDELKRWYKTAIEKARQDIARIANSNKLDEDQQFYLFYAFDAFHHEHYSQAIQNRWEFEENCQHCEEELVFEFFRGNFEVAPTKQTKQTKQTKNLEKLVIRPSNIQEEIFEGDAYKAFVYQLARNCGQDEFANWIGMMHSPFKCPACGKNSSILPP